MRISLGAIAALLAAAPRLADAQELSVTAQAIPVVTRADPTATRAVLAEGYLSQPAVMAHGAFAWLTVRATLNLEGLTLERGELNTGGYGEGYVDRRHPHAYAHEVLIGAEHSHGGFQGSLFMGRGFAPFGSDDPMARPFEKFPINHHLAQVLERVVAIAAVRRGNVIGEIGTFNGDEPTSPSNAPNFERFGDSWAARLTILPLGGVEVSGSLASVTSPEVRTGHGLDQRKSSIVARFNSESSASWRYGLIELAHTAEQNRGETVNSLTSILGEAAYCARGVILATRYEFSERPEEEQLSDPFRSPRPATDLNNLGISRWRVLTASASTPAARVGVATLRPFVEVAFIHAARGNPAGLFSPELRYGANRMWMVSGGLRFRAGARHDRMGRYGVALPASVMQHGTQAGHDASDMSPGAPHSSPSPAATANHASNGRCVL